MKDIYNMKLHERLDFDRDNSDDSFADFTEVLRVPGGWVYIHYSDIQPGNDDLSCFNMTSQFVPWHDSGRLIKYGDNYSELREKLKKAEAALEDIDIDSHDMEKICSILRVYYDNKNTQKAPHTS